MLQRMDEHRQIPRWPQTLRYTTPDLSCRLRWSTQHLLAVFPLESEILKFFSGVDSSAARLGRAALEKRAPGQYLARCLGCCGEWSTRRRLRTNIRERMPPPDQSYWKRVLVRCNPQVISRSERVGRVGVDYARLLIADFDVLGAWQHEDSLDGLSDFVF